MDIVMGLRVMPGVTQRTSVCVVNAAANGLWTGRLQNLRGRNLNSAATVSEWVRNSNASAMNCLARRRQGARGRATPFQ